MFSEKEIRKDIPFKITKISRNKYLEINLTREVKDLYNKKIQDIKKGYHRRY